MKNLKLLLFVSLFVLLFSMSPRKILSEPNVFVYFGMCDGSAAMWIDETTFVVASDERNAAAKNVLGIYNVGKSQPTTFLDLSDALKPESEDNEADLEGAARIGNRIFWIASHGRNKNGKLRPDRARFFATDIVDGKLSLARKEQVLPSYPKLLTDLIADSRYKKFGLSELSSLALPPEAGGINIEGLAATPDGKLFIGFRSPLIDGKALIAVLENPNEVVEGKTAKFGAPIQVGLDGAAIRDITFSTKKNAYLILAGSIADSSEFSLYEWKGNDEKPKKMKYADFKNFNPEAIFIFPNSDKIQIISDDGSLMKAAASGKMQENKELPDGERTFRSLSLMAANDTWILE